MSTAAAADGAGPTTGPLAKIGEGPGTGATVHGLRVELSKSGIDVVDDIDLVIQADAPDEYKT